MQGPVARIPGLVAACPTVSLHWDDLRFVLALKRAGSLGAAARLLKVEPSTVSRRLAALEDALGAPLAARNPEGLVLNDAGQAAAELAETIQRGIQDLQSSVGGEDQRPEGVVRLATTESTAIFLMRALIPLRAEYPKIRVELVVGSAALDLVRHEADLAVRMFRENSPTLVSRKVGEIGWGIFAMKSLVDAHGVTIGGPEVLRGLPIVGFKEPVSKAPGPRWLAERVAESDIVLRGDSVTSVLNAVTSGMGASALPLFVAAQTPGLVRIVDEVVGCTEAYVVMPPDHKRLVRVRLVADAIATVFKTERALLTGEA